MNEERFHELANAFGADLGRWPEAERSAASAFLGDRRDLALALLAGERVLDEALGAYASAEPGQALRWRIIEAAPRQRVAGRVQRWIAGAGLGLGLAASCAAGVAAGFSFAPPDVAHMIGAPMIGQPSATSDISSLADPVGDAASG